MNRRSFLELLSAGAATPVMHRLGRRRIETDIVIYGAGAGGVCAGIQAARLGAHVVMIEPSVWVGGMITSAGVSALDGNKYGLGGGLVKEFRDKLLARYGSDEALFSGWVSLTCFEPHVGQTYLQDLMRPLDNLSVLYNTEAIGYEATGSRERRIHAINIETEETTELICSLFIDCTEYGDGLKLARVPYRLGRESQDELGEPSAPPEPDLEMQDLTYVATLVKRESGVDVEPMPLDPYWDLFECSTRVDCSNPDEAYYNHNMHSWESFITYGMLPNNKVMINWPFHANDYPVNIAFFEDRYYRRFHNASAKQHTLQFVRYLQHELGHPEWQLATDEYPSPDHLPLIPYIRESRRMVNDHIMVEEDVIAVGDNPRAPMVDNVIAVGDYYLDHHHSKAHLPPDKRLDEQYPDNAPFQMPATVFFPSNDDSCFMVGEKSISVSHIINGCSRLQPVVMLMGQAIGVIAARAVQRGVAPANVPIPEVQRILIDAGCQLFPVYDIYAGDPLFKPVQELALEGVFNESDPLHFEPAEPLNAELARTWLSRIGKPDLSIEATTNGEFLQRLYAESNS